MKTLVANRIIIVSIVLTLMSLCFIAEETYSQVSISEIMYGSERRFSPEQWIEISNLGTKTIDLTGWTLTIQNRNSSDLTVPVTAKITFQDDFWGDAPRIWPKKTVLVVSNESSENSSNLEEEQVYNLRWRQRGLDLGLWDTILSAEGFYVKLTNKAGRLVDEAGNFKGNRLQWTLPFAANRGKTQAGHRTSIIRREVNDVPRDGTKVYGWIAASEADLKAADKTYYGDAKDISSPGIGNVEIRTPLPEILRKVSGNSQQGASNTALAKPFVVQVRDQNKKPLSGIPVSFRVTAGGGKLSVNKGTTDSKGLARSTLTLGPNPDKNSVMVSADGFRQIFTATATDGAPIPNWDVNRDGKINRTDLVIVSKNFGLSRFPNRRADVNRDGAVDIDDLILVAEHFGEGESMNAAAPASIVRQPKLDPKIIQIWLTLARTRDDGSITFRRGIANLEQLLATIIPEESTLLANYPNPFNPETWIPYQLSEAAEVTLRIYSANGVLVWTLSLGHLSAGTYQSRSRAAYWDGRNAFGEPVASGVYFYTLTAGEFTATRKMLIRK